jgi:hypothetical protein
MLRAAFLTRHGKSLAYDFLTFGVVTPLRRTAKAYHHKFHVHEQSNGAPRGPMTDALEIADRLVVLLKMMVNDPVSISAALIPDNIGNYTIRFSVPKNEIERVSGIERSGPCVLSG